MTSKPDDPFDRSEFFAPIGQEGAGVRPVMPVVIGMTHGWKLVLGAVGFLILSFSVWGMVYFAYVHPVDLKAEWQVLLVATIAFMLVGLYFTAAAIRMRIILHPDVLEYHKPLGSLRILRAEIASYRFGARWHIPCLELTLRHTERVCRVTGGMFTSEPQFASWLAGQRNIDTLFNPEVVDEKVSADKPDAENWEEESEEISIRPQGWVVALGVISYILAGAALFSSHPLLIGSLLFLPWLAIGMARRFGTVKGRGKEETLVHGDFYTAYTMSAIGLAIIALKMSNLEDWAKMLPVGLESTTVLLMLAAWSAPKLMGVSGRLVSTSLFFALYAFSTLAICNVYFDKVLPDDEVIDVTGKFYRATYSGTHYYLLVLPLGSTKPAQEINVNAEFYEVIRPGQVVCIHNHRGLFNLPWYEVAHASDCQGAFGGPGR